MRQGLVHVRDARMRRAQRWAELIPPLAVSQLAYLRQRTREGGAGPSHEPADEPDTEHPSLANEDRATWLF